MVVTLGQEGARCMVDSCYGIIAVNAYRDRQIAIGSTYIFKYEQASNSTKSPRRNKTASYASGTGHEIA